jgi:hypothetical protein
VRQKKCDRKNRDRKSAVEKVWQKNRGRKSAAQKLQQKNHGKKGVAEKSQKKTCGIKIAAATWLGSVYERYEKSCLRYVL